jgi:hypothetical protein
MKAFGNFVKMTEYRLSAKNILHLMIMKLGPDTDKPTVSLVKSQTQEGGLKRIGKRLVAGFDEVVKVIGAQTNINHWLLR